MLQIILWLMRKLLLVGLLIDKIINNSKTWIAISLLPYKVGSD